MVRFFAFLLMPLFPLLAADKADSAALQQAAAAIKDAAGALRESAAALKEAAAALKSAQGSRPPTPEESAARLRAEEEKEAAAEEAAERKLPAEESAIHVYEGNLKLHPPADQSDLRAAIGALITPEKTYLVKVESAEMRAALQALDGKQTRIGGKPRNNGKYLLALELLVPGASPTYSRKRGGV